jgi:hypothetical protein
MSQNYPVTLVDCKKDPQILDHRSGGLPPPTPGDLENLSQPPFAPQRRRLQVIVPDSRELTSTIHTILVKYRRFMNFQRDILMN